MAIHFHQDDLPSSLDFGDMVAIDTETMGLNPIRDRLCLVQLSRGDGDAHLVKIANPKKPCPNLKALLTNTNVTKLFHFARFDIASLSQSITEVKGPIYCTKIASKLARTYTDRHGLKDLCRELLQIDISNTSNRLIGVPKRYQQNRPNMPPVMFCIFIKFAISLKQYWHVARTAIAASCFAFLPTQSQLDLEGFGIWISSIIEASSSKTKASGKNYKHFFKDCFRNDTNMNETPTSKRGRFTPRQKQLTHHLSVDCHCHCFFWVSARH